MTLKIGEEEARFWDLLIKAIAGVFAIFTVWSGFQALSTQQQQLKTQQDQFEKTSQEEYHRKFWEKKLDAYIRLCNSAALLSFSNTNSPEFERAKHDVLMIYSGELHVLASPQVKQAFVDFLKVLADSRSFSGQEGIQQQQQVN
jgi:hypothetical protein